MALEEDCHPLIVGLPIMVASRPKLSSLAGTLESWLRIPLKAWMCVLFYVNFLCVFLFNFLNGVRLRPLCTSATNWPIVPTPDDN
jgi:succinate dehydrogenase/fumarate reductase cytochrome b subunit